MNEVLAAMTRRLDAAWSWARSGLLTPGAAWELLAVAATLVLSMALAAPMRARLERRFGEVLSGVGTAQRTARTALRLAGNMLALPLLLAAEALVRSAGLQGHIVHAALSLVTAWVLIRMAAALFLSRFWGRLFAAVVWTGAALEIVGLFDPVVRVLDSWAFSVGDVRVTPIMVAKAGVLLVVLFRAGGWVSSWVDARLRGVPELTPSSRVLLGKVVRVTVFVLVAVTGLASLGIDLTGLAVFSGAVGVGVGFGLQKVVGNLISGFILLMDKSIKPGDVIQIGEVYGWIRELRARFVSVVTRDGTEYLIPNEDLITTQVVNWSFSDRNVRLKIPVGVSYGADPHRVMELMLQAARGAGRVLAEPGPVCLLTGFGDSSVDLELRVWIDDPENGVANVRSDILVRVWDAFKEHGVEIPFPQRDVHIKEPVRVVGGPEPDRGGPWGD